MYSFFQFLVVLRYLQIVNISFIAMFLEFFMGIQPVASDVKSILLQLVFLCLISDILNQQANYPIRLDELQKIYSKLLKMIVQRSRVEEASGSRSLLAIEMNKDTLLLIMSIKLPNSSLSILNAAKPDGLPKKNLLKDCGSVVQSILKKLKENSSLNFKLKY